MKKLVLLCLLTHLPSTAGSSASLPPASSSPHTVKIVNQRRHKLMLGELHRALGTCSNALKRYKRQNELNQALPVRSRIVPKQSDVQQHVATYGPSLK
jgi:hypothetical protein